MEITFFCSGSLEHLNAKILITRIGEIFFAVNLRRYSYENSM